MNQKRILYEDQDIIVCHKAAGIATQTARVGQADMVSEVRNYLSRSGGGGMPYVGVVHRLDQPVEGILVFAKNKKAAAGLSRQITEEQTEKYYYAVVCGHSFARQGDLEDYLWKDGRTNTSSVAPPEIKDAKRAFLHYEIIAQREPEAFMGMEGYGTHQGNEDTGGEPERVETVVGGCKLALARIRLYTGRHHQIRVQLSNAGMSLLGDYKYADEEAVAISKQMHVKEAALCAYRLSFLHPGTGRRMEFRIRPEGKCFRIAEFWETFDRLDGTEEVNIESGGSVV